MNNLIKNRLFWVLFFIVLGTQMYSQRVAVVLSGGGAKGFAHIGVLKALEEYEIPIDYITGTSMGAVVGGLYASGYSPDSIAAIISSPKFSQWTSGLIDDQYTYYFKKEEPDASWISVKFNYDDVNRKITGKLPITLIPSFELDFNIIELYAEASAAASYDFNELFVPFRCVAADIESNKAVIFSEGQLGTAVRASMTFPFYLKPIEVDGKYLFDGGMYNNFPSDIAMNDFNPDVIIGSKAAGNYRSPTDDDLVLQVQNMLMTPADFDLDTLTGILLEHQLENRSLFDFSQPEEVILDGYKTTLDNMGGIYDLIQRRVTASELEDRREAFQKNKPPIVVDSINITGLTESQSEYVRKLFKHRDELIDLETVKVQYFKLIADEKIRSIFPELRYNKRTGYYDLNLHIRKSENFVGSFGGNISSGTSNTAFIGLEYRYFAKQSMNLKTNLYLGRFYNSFKLGGRIDFPTRLPFFMELGYIYNSKNYFRNATYFFDDKTPSFLISRESFGYYSMGIPASNNGKLILGLNYGGRRDEYYQENAFSREDTADLTYFDLYTPHLVFELNSLNRRQFADKGARLLVRFSYIDGKERHIPGSTSLHDSTSEYDHSWLELKLLYDNYFDHFGPVSLGFYGELQLSNQGFFDSYTSSLLSAPAFEPVLESKTLFLPKYRAYNYAAAGLKMVLNVYRKIDFRLEGYLFQPYQEILSGEGMAAEYGKEFSYRSIIGSTSVVWHSPIGPVSLSLNYYDRNNDKYTIFFNFGYIIFNSSVME